MRYTVRYMGYSIPRPTLAAARTYCRMVGGGQIRRTSNRNRKA